MITFFFYLNDHPLFSFKSVGFKSGRVEHFENLKYRNDLNIEGSSS